MKKVIVFVIIIVLLAAGAYTLYRTVMPTLVAEAVVSESTPDYIPKRLQTRVESVRKPLNQGTEALLKEMHAAEIPVDKVLTTIDNVTEEDAYAFLDELNREKPSTTDEVFDLAKKHFPTDFDPEVFREPFKRHFTIAQIRKGISLANLNRRSPEIDITTAKAIVKRIIVEKEKELRGNRD